MSDKRAEAVERALEARKGEAWVEPRLERTRRVLELLDDPLLRRQVEQALRART